jgi:ketosteroid isomerase-like protein
MYRASNWPIALLSIVLAGSLAWSQLRARTPNIQPTREDFPAAIRNIRETWVREFNAGHADKVAALYAQEAVLIRKNGSVHSRDSIQAELSRSITAARGHNYTVESLHTEYTGDLGYDTGIYNEDFPHHVSEGNYLMVIKKTDGEWKIVAHAAVPNPRQK